MFHTPKKPTPAKLKPSYHGDEIHPIKVPTHECVLGDTICFLKTQFSGKPGEGSTPAGYELISGQIVHASYGPIVQKNFYTVLANGKKRVITNKQLYFNGCYRKKWIDESVRAKLLAEKIANGYMN